MAKKKANHQAKDPHREVRKQDGHNENHQKSSQAMDDPAEKLQSLKSLNSLLVKETIGCRQQVDSLVNAKVALETELTRYGKEKEVFIAELTRTGEVIVESELEKLVICAFVNAKMVQLVSEFNGLVKDKENIERVKSERDVEIEFLKEEVNKLEVNLKTERYQLRRVCEERDTVKSDFDNLFEEANKLRMEVVEIEKREKKVVEEVKNLKVEAEMLVSEKAERGKAVEAAIREKELVEITLEKSTKVIDDLKIKIAGVVREKNDIEHEKRGCEVKIYGLEKEICQLNGIVSSLRKENETMVANVLQLEKSVGESAEKEKLTAKEINALIEDQKVKENSIMELKDQNDLLEKDLERACKESEGVLQNMETLIQEQKEIEEIKVRKEGEILEMQNELSGVKKDVSMLKELCTIEKEKNAQLISEVNNHKEAVDSIMREKDEAQKCFRDEKKNVEDLRSVVSQMEKKIEETLTQLNRMNKAQDDLLKNKEAMKHQIENLLKDKASAEMNLSEAQCGIDDLSSRIKSATFNSERALVLLKETADIVGHDNKELDVKELNHEDETQAYAAELNVIRLGFNKKQKMVEELKQQLELEQTKAAKRKNFWAMLTTAITILAAASAAYIAKGR